MKAMKGKKLSVLTMAGAAAAVLLVPAFARAQVVVVPPPAPYREVVPAPRVGQVWHPGYWQWAHGRYMWMPGGWSAVVAGAPPVMAPPPPPRVERLSADALFPFDRGDVSDIRPAGLADIATIAAHLRASPFSHVEVRGYTDRLGSDAYNLQLSIQRANAVKAVLVRDGVPADKVRAVGLGSQDPVTTQCGNLPRAALVQCLQPDRRVEIVTYVRDPVRWRR